MVKRIAFAANILITSFLFVMYYQMNNYRETWKSWIHDALTIKKKIADGCYTILEADEDFGNPLFTFSRNSNFHELNKMKQYGYVPNGEDDFFSCFLDGEHGEWSTAKVYGYHFPNGKRLICILFCNPDGGVLDFVFYTKEDG